MRNDYKPVKLGRSIACHAIMTCMDTKVCPSCSLPKAFPFDFNSQGCYCLDCHRENGRQWREKNLEKSRESSRKWKEKVEYKPEIEKQRAASRRHYQKHKAEYVERSRIKHQEVVEWYKNYKKKQLCCRCGNNDFRCLVFHHIRDKEFNIAANKGVSIPRLRQEIEKCIVLCQNCHAIEHYNDIEFALTGLLT